MFSLEKCELLKQSDAKCVVLHYLAAQEPIFLFSKLDNMDLYTILFNSDQMWKL